MKADERTSGVSAAVCLTKGCLWSHGPSAKSTRVQIEAQVKAHLISRPDHRVQAELRLMQYVTYTSGEDGP